MRDPRWIFLAAAVLGGLAVWLLLPPGRKWGRAAGGLLGVVSLGGLAAALPGFSDWIAQSVFWVLAAVTIVSAAAAMTFRNPVYCAIWFGLSLAGVAGLFFSQGAQFLGVATIVVYAGAILVTFLFLLMLAQPSGRARYDRLSWESVLSTACGAFLVGVLSTTVTGVLASPRSGRDAPKVTQHDRQQVVLSNQHVRQFGSRLFSRYLVAVEVAGVLLLAALVGAAVIVGRARGPLLGPSPAESPLARRTGEGPGVSAAETSPAGAAHG